MATLRGIDVSYANGVLDWAAIKLTGEVDFAILRAGYGQNNLDAQFNRNVQGCVAQSIPFGIYWFSYALNQQNAYDEGDYACDRLEATNATLSLGIWYDWEYDSDTYAASQGVTMTPYMREQFALKFLEACQNRGYSAGIYTNPDYLNRGLQGVVDAGWPLWLAQWGVSVPSRPCSIWQYGITHITGINGDFDGDMISDDYPPIPPTPGPTPTPTDKRKMPLWMYLRRYF